MKPNVLTPLFEIVAHIAMEADIELVFDCRRLSDGAMQLYWYVGDATMPLAGDLFERIYTDDLDEDKLNRWVAELEALVFEPEPSNDRDKESVEDNHKTENAVHDSMERDYTKREKL